MGQPMSDVRAIASGSDVSVDLAQVARGVDELVREPVNPVKLVVLTSLSRYFGSDVELVSESLVGSTYSIKARVRK